MHMLKSNTKLALAMVVNGWFFPLLLPAASPEVPNGPHPYVIFMGNSITQGWVNAYPELFESGDWENCGIGGQTTVQLLERFDCDVLRKAPDVVVLGGGTNDIAGLGGPTTVDAIYANLLAMVEAARSKHIAVVLCAILPAASYACCPDVDPVPWITELNARLRSYAAIQGFVFADYHTLLVDERNAIRSEWTEDGVHPNKAGYAKMLPLTLASILNAYGQHRKGNQ